MSSVYKKIINDTLTEFENINVYIYDYDKDYSWLINVVASCDLVLIDIDSSLVDIRSLIGYILSKNQTFYLTNDSIMPYNMINPNKINSLDMFFNKLRGINEKQR